MPFGNSTLYLFLLAFIACSVGMHCCYQFTICIIKLYGCYLVCQFPSMHLVVVLLQLLPVMHAHHFHSPIGIQLCSVQIGTISLLRLTRLARAKERTWWAVSIIKLQEGQTIVSKSISKGFDFDSPAGICFLHFLKLVNFGVVPRLWVQQRYPFEAD